ncbi:hypothetical protein L7F22_054136 [Adiantum nelumboides]|nr:hypothetical protein [Adiantum nelumboides]
MVLSNKKLKRRLRAEPAREQSTLLLSVDQLKSINKREKKRQQRQQQLENLPPQQSASPQTSPIDQAELDNYHHCIRSLLHEGDLSPSLGQGQDAENVPVAAPRLPVKESQNAEASLPTLVNSEQNSLNVNFPSLPESTPKSRKRRRASKENARTEELGREPDKVDNDSARDQDLSESWTVYVGGIPYYSSEDDIKAFFGDCGTITEVNLKNFSDSGKFRGIALLTFKTTGGAQRALALDGSSMGDRFLKVQPCAAKPKEHVKKEVYVTPPTKTEGYKRAYIGNLSWSVTEEDIRDFFQGCKIDKVKFSEDKATGEFRGFGHVDFADDESLERAVKLDQEILLDRPLKVAYAVPEKRATVTRDRKNITCHTCGEQGHVSSRCPYMGRG